MKFLPKAVDPLERIALLEQALAAKENQLQLSELKVLKLEEFIRLLRIQKYGAKSEQLSDAQLAMLELEPGVSNLEVEAESQRAAIDLPEAPKKRGKHPGRQTLPPHLPRVERIVACSPEQQKCTVCHNQTVVIGYERSERLDVEPAKYFVLVLKREKRACSACERHGIVCAPLPLCIVEKGLASDQVVIDTIMDKYMAHLPLYRQSVILERDSGVEISRTTMDHWVMRVGDLLTPVAEQMRRELVRSHYLQADETPVPVQTHDRRGKNHQGYLWQYSRPNGEAIFDFRMTRGGDGPKQILANFEGILQTDGYSAYNALAGQKVVHAACWAHCRRGFSDAVKLSPEDKTAIAIVASIDELFAVDAQAREQSMDHQARHLLRQERAAPLVPGIKMHIEAAASKALPGTKFSRACNYTLNLWPRLVYFLDYPELELSTNLAENSMRPVAIGRKNWTHLGSQQAAPKVAAILSVMETCRRLDIPVREYLGSVLPQLADLSIQQLNTVTPSAWFATRN